MNPSIVTWADRFSRDCNKFEEFLHAAARNVIVNEIFHELGHSRDICGRENQGGVVSRTSGKTIPGPKFTAAEAIEQIWATRTLGASPHTYVSSEDAEKMDKVISHYGASQSELISMIYTMSAVGIGAVSALFTHRLSARSANRQLSP
jgi:hypothetical protein